MGGGEPGRDRLSSKYLDARVEVPAALRSLCEEPCPGHGVPTRPPNRGMAALPAALSDWLMAVAVAGALPYKGRVRISVRCH